MENISWTDHVRNEEVLHRVKEERNLPQTIQRRDANWVGHIWRRNCLLKTCYWRKDEGKDVSGVKARKKR